MRFYFPNLERPKKAAKHIARTLCGDVSLSKVQQGVATALGYSDWHELDVNHSSSVATPLDQLLSDADFIRRSADLTLRLANALGIPNSAAQHALSASHLTGERKYEINDHVKIRMMCWQESGAWPTFGSAGKTVLFRVSRPGSSRPALLTANFDSRGRDVVQVIGDNFFGICVRNEITIPRVPIAPFIPLRLRLAYGAWTEPDGAKVLFSRDYAPIWRIRDGLPPQQTSPTDWIKFDDEKWFWDDLSPWDNPKRVAEEEARLVSFGIRGLPSLVDLLPVMVCSTGQVPAPRRLIEDMRRPKALAG